MSFHEVFNFAYAVLTIVGAAGTYFAFRGRQFGLTDLLIFLPLAAGGDWLAYWLFKMVSSGAAYEGLVALLLLLGVIPVVAGLNLVAAVAVLASLIRYPAVRFAALGLAAVAWLVHLSLGKLGDVAAPGGMMNNDRLAGENWALESGATAKADCDRQSQTKAFRDGCYARLRK